MYNLVEPFVMPEKVMLRTQYGSADTVGSCHMAVPLPDQSVMQTIGSCHMAVPQLDNIHSQCRKHRGPSKHKEVVVLG